MIFLDILLRIFFVIIDIRCCYYYYCYPFLLLNHFSLQRGTGLSTPLTYSSLSQFKSAEDLADYAKHFRADNIVNDAEFIRVRLVPGAGPWTVLGQVVMLSFLG